MMSPLAPVGLLSLALQGARLGARAARGAARAIAHRGEVRRLAELDDRALRDIGLVRSDVASALAEPLFRDPSTVLVRINERWTGSRALRVPDVEAPRRAPRLRDLERGVA